MSDEWIDEYYQDIYKWSLSKTRNRFDAEDLTQEIIYQATKMFRKILDIKSYEKYLWKVAYYTWCSKAKDYEREKVVIRKELDLSLIRDDSVDLANKIEIEEMNKQLKKIIDGLSEKMKECVNLYYFDEFKVKDIAQKLNINESLVKYYLYEARKKIKQEILKEMEKEYEN